MTVAELRNKLSVMPPNAVVVIMDKYEEFYTPSEVGGVALEPTTEDMYAISTASREAAPETFTLGVIIR